MSGEEFRDDQLKRWLSEEKPGHDFTSRVMDRIAGKSETTVRYESIISGWGWAVVAAVFCGILVLGAWVKNQGVSTDGEVFDMPLPGLNIPFDTPQLVTSDKSVLLVALGLCAICILMLFDRWLRKLRRRSFAG